MCGIAGRWNLDGRLLRREVLCKMTGVLAHRGPDDHGTVSFLPDGHQGWSAEFSASLHGHETAQCQGGLGNTRLRVIDLTEQARQPLTNEDGSLWITYNGEVYNFRSLREQLLNRGHRFRSRSDSEVVLHAYEEWGPSCVAHFNGMFAFAILDTREKVLFLARDRLGIKPLYYCHTQEFFAFASEPKALFTCPDISPVLDPKALFDYLVLGYTTSPRSFFRNIQRLPPACTLTMRLEQREAARPTALPPRLVRYWDVRFGSVDSCRSYSQIEEELRELIKDAVRLRMVSDVPLGAFLSGGIDSSVIVSQMTYCSAAPIRTFSVGFRDHPYNELGCARKVSDCFKTSHHERVLDPRLIEDLKSVLYFYDEPLADTSILPTFELCRLAKEYVTVALSGDGGDELFAGYWQHGQAARALYAPYLPPLARLIAARIAVHGASRIKDTSEIAVRLCGLPLKRSIGIRLEGDPGDVWARRLLKQELLHCLGKYSPYEVLRDYYLSGPVESLPLDRIQNVDLKAYLPEDILTKVDRASMAYGLEVRVPFLDHRLVEYAARLPASMRISNGRTKAVLKDIFEDVVPKEIVDRPKQGFAIPEVTWLGHGNAEHIEKRLTSPEARISSVIDQKEVRTLFAEFGKGSSYLSRVIWALVILEEWFALMDQYGGVEVSPL